jgi:hypothetical protein
MSEIILLLVHANAGWLSTVSFLDRGWHYRYREAIVSSTARVATTEPNPSVVQGDLIADLGQPLEYARVSVIQSDSIGHGMLCFGYIALSAADAASHTFRKLR